MNAEKINVAETSTNGHFVEGAKQVILLDERQELFLVSGKSTLTTENHTTLEMEDDCLIVPQRVYSHVSKRYNRVLD